MNSLSTVKTELTVPELGVLGVTRGMLGAGLALLLAHRLSAQRRETVGWTLAAIGLATSIPLAILVFGSRKRGSAR